MFRTALISCDKGTTFNRWVNEFIKDKKIVDIKYMSLPCYEGYIDGVPTQLSIVDRALIIYEVDENKQEDLTDDRK